MICDTGGVAVLAHPWSLKNPLSIIKRLKEAGLHGMEVYRSDGKLAGKQSVIQLLAPFCIICNLHCNQCYRIYLTCTSSTSEI